jgi:uncharacterized repeat protein (TIGR01451 family)
MGLSCDIGAYEVGGGSLQKSVNQVNPFPGQRITYTINAVNTMTNTLTNALISDTLPSGLTFAGAIILEPPDAGTPGTAPPTLASNLTISPGEKITLTLPVTVNADVLPGTHITNTAYLELEGLPSLASGSSTIAVCGKTITVTSSADDGPGSLREAIANVCTGGRIEFDLTTPTTITLTSGELLIERAMTIAGPGRDADHQRG